MKNSINNKDLIFIFFGGTMRGIFGAGVVTSLQEQNVYDRIHSIYAISAGAHDAAYFLARDTKLGSSIYYEDLILKDKFIKNRKSKFLYELFLRLISKKNKVKSLVDIDYLIEVEESNKRLKIEEIYKSSIPFYIRLFNMKEKREEYVNGKTNILEKLHAAAAATPFYNKKIKINGNFYTDGDLLSRIIDKNLEKVIQEHSDKKIFLVFNDSKVIPARLHGKKETGGAIEIFLLAKTKPPLSISLQAFNLLFGFMRQKLAICRQKVSMN